MVLDVSIQRKIGISVCLVGLAIAVVAILVARKYSQRLAKYRSKRSSYSKDNSKDSYNYSANQQFPLRQTSQSSWSNHGNDPRRSRLNFSDKRPVDSTSFINFTPPREDLVYPDKMVSRSIQLAMGRPVARVTPVSRDMHVARDMPMTRGMQAARGMPVARGNLSVCPDYSTEDLTLETDYSRAGDFGSSFENLTIDADYNLADGQNGHLLNYSLHQYSHTQRPENSGNNKAATELRTFHQNERAFQNHIVNLKVAKHQNVNPLFLETDYNIAAGDVNLEADYSFSAYSGVEADVVSLEADYSDADNLSDKPDYSEDEMQDVDITSNNNPGNSLSVDEVLGNNLPAVLRNMPATQAKPFNYLIP